MSNITSVVFGKEGEKTIYKDLWQYDYGQILRIEGLNLPKAVEIHFSLQETGGEAKRRIGITESGVTDVVIPDFILEGNKTTRDYYAYAFIYVADEESGETTHKIKMSIKSRPEPEGNTGTDETSFGAIMAAVNKIAEGVVSDEQVQNAVNKYLDENPIEAVSDAQIEEAVSNYLMENPIETGATKEQAEQIEKNTQDISKLSEQKVDGVGIGRIIALTQAEYNALEEKVATTLYIITDVSVDDSGNDDGEGGDSGGGEDLPTNMVPYLLTDGASYIDTGYKPTMDDTYEITLRDNEPVNNEAYFGNNYMVCNCAGSTWFSMTHGSVYAGYQAPTSTAKMTLKRTPTEYFANDESIGTYELGSFSVESYNKPLSLFAQTNTSGAVYKHSTFYFFGLKIWQGETLVHDYQPTQDSEGVACVYDAITKEYLYNSGTGTLTYGTELEES